MMTISKKFMLPFIYVYRVFMYIRGRIFLNRLILEKHDNEIYLCFPVYTGDCVYALNTLEALQEKYPNKRFIAVGCKCFGELFGTHKHIYRLRILEAKDFKKLQHFLFFTSLAFKGFRYGIINMHISVYYHIYKKVSLDDNRRALHLFRKILGTSKNASINYHCIKTIPVHSIENFKQIKKRAVIINPYSTSMKTTMKVYEYFCEELIHRGFIVFTNIVGEQEAVKGSIPLRCSLQELFSIACEIPLVVSVRSGVLDLIIPSGISMFVVYDHASILMKEVYALDGWQSKCRIQEVIIDTDDEMKLLPEKFSHFLDDLKAEGRIS